MLSGIKKTLSLVFVIGTLAFGGVCQAQALDASVQSELVEAEKRFKAADKDGDGKLTLEEARHGMPRIADAFKHIDIDNRGYVTLDQIKAIIIKNAR